MDEENDDRGAQEWKLGSLRRCRKRPERVCQATNG